MKLRFFSICRVLLILLASAISVDTFAQSICFCYKGSWSQWARISTGSYSWNNDRTIYEFKTDGGIVYFSFQIIRYNVPDKKTIKQFWKTNTWFEYDGVVTYYVSDQYPNVEELAKKCVLVAPNPRTDTTPKVKRTAMAKIRVAPYRTKYPTTYNIWVDGIGIGISL